jgi:hypothetical protein
MENMIRSFKTNVHGTLDIYRLSENGKHGS